MFDHGLTHAALAGHDAVYLAYAAAVAQGLDLKGAVFALAAVFAYGAGAEKFAGIFKNKELPGIIEELIK